MKLFVYKIIFFFISIFLLYHFTIGYTLRKIENKIYHLKSPENIDSIKQLIRKEIKSALSKDKILEDDDQKLIIAFIKKIKKELDY